MRCEEFEHALQQQSDGCRSKHDEVAFRLHSQSCRACHELEEGFRLFSQAFTVSRVPAPSNDLTERILAGALTQQQVHPWWRRSAVPLSAAAGLLLAVGWWLSGPAQAPHESPTIAGLQPLPISHSPNEEPLFPELGDAQASDSRDGVALVEAVEPVSRIFRAVGRSIGSPVRPIAITASEALGNLIKEFPEADSTMMMSMPGMREFMPQPMKKKMGAMRPSSDSS